MHFGKSQQGGDGMDWIRENQILVKKIGIIVGVYLGMKYLVPLVIPFLIAALLVCWCQPLLRWAKNRLHLRPPVVMAGLILTVVVLAAGGIYLAGQRAGGSLLDFLRGFRYQGQVEQFVYDCCDRVSGLLHMESEDLRIFVTEQMNVFQDKAQQNILPGAMDGSWQVVKRAGGVLAGVLVAGIATLLLAADFEKIKEIGRGSRLYGKTVGAVRGILQSVGGYLKAQGIIMGIVMVICVAGIWIAGWASGEGSGSVQNSILAGIATGFLDALPVFGTGTVFLPWIFIKILQKKYTAAVILAVTYGLCVLAREILEPKLVGDKLGVLPIVILASVYVGVRIYGLGGIFLGPVSVLLIQELWKQVEE